MTKKIIFSLIFFIASMSYLYADNVTDKFNEANDLYKAGKFAEAVSLYQEVLNDGYKSAEVYYNLGNSYFKLDKIPDAILYYERGRRILPDDEDINFNLKIANLKIVDKIQTVPKLFFVEWYESLFGLHSSATWANMIIVFSWLTFIFLTVYFIIWNTLLRKISFFMVMLSFIITLACVVFSVEQNNLEEVKKDAIIFAPSVYIKSSPDKESTDLFILHEGSKVNILDEVGKWKKIKIADGNVGWLPNKTIEII